MNEIIENNELIEDDVKIENMIYQSRGVPIMLDSDLAFLYGVPTKRINEAVKNNPKKFPERFSWKLTDNENEIFLVENFDQKNIEMRGGRYKNPRVFTEHGILMLATILKSDVAIEISIRIMDAFVAMRHFIIENKDIYKSLNNINIKLIDHENKMLEYDNKFDYIFSKFDRKEQLLLKGQTFEAYKSVDILFKNIKKIVENNDFF